MPLIFPYKYAIKPFFLRRHYNGVLMVLGNCGRSLDLSCSWLSNRFRYLKRMQAIEWQNLQHFFQKTLRVSLFRFGEDRFPWLVGIIENASSSLLGATYQCMFQPCHMRSIQTVIV